MEQPSFYLKKAYASGHTLLLRYLRRLAKELVIFTPLVVLAFVIFNLWFPKTSFEKTKSALIQNPTAFENHLALAKILTKYHNYDTANLELQKIPRTAKTREVLTTISLQTNSPLVVQDNIKFWSSISQKNPSFRDALVKSAILNWKIYRPFETTKLLTKALALDPNNKFLRDLSSKLK